MNTTLSHTEIDRWTEGGDAPVALHLREVLMPVEGHGAPVFPATYAGIGYQIDTVADGTKLASLDSVGSQANRIEPMFRQAPFAALVPQIDITYGNDQTFSVLEAGHRLGDAVIRCTALAGPVRAAFEEFLRVGDASALAKIGPTSILLGVWDSRDTQAKLPRVLQSVIRAWDVSELKRSAQFNPALDYAGLEVFSEAEREKQEGKAGSQLAERGYVHVPAVGSHGGVIARGEIRRDATLNLVALQRLRGADAPVLRHYILGLGLVALLEPQDGFLRAGCQLVPDPDAPRTLSLVARDGTRSTLALTREVALDYARAAAAAFGVGSSRQVTFDKALAKADAAAGKKAGKKAEA